MAQITSITSEALQAKIRTLLPSQQGFGEDLQAQNVIVPIIDLTATAEGSATPEFLQRAWDSTTSNFNSKAATTSTVINTTGFWQVGFTVNLIGTVTGATAGAMSLRINTGLATTDVWTLTKLVSSGVTSGSAINDEIVVFLNSGHSLEYTNSSSTFAHISLWYRQIADINGNLVEPAGFSPQ